jgi:hypothetical protein
MMNPKTFADAVGRKQIADAIGVGATAVSNAVVRGQLPAAWYLACTKLAQAHGIECPIEMFAMREANSQDVNLFPAVQGAAE